MIFRYVPHARVQDYQSLGWVIVGSRENNPHSFWAIPMRWIGEGDPQEPRKQEARAQ